MTTKQKKQKFWLELYRNSTASAVSIGRFLKVTQAAFCGETIVFCPTTIWKQFWLSRLKVEVALHNGKEDKCYF